MIEIDPELALTLKHLVKELLIPPSGFVTLAFAGVVVAGLWRRWRRFGTGVAFVSLLVLYASVLEPGSRWLIDQVESQAGAALDETQARALMQSAGPPQALVILGGGQTRDVRELPYRDNLAPAALMRTLAGARLARWTGLPVLTSGGAPVGQAPESEIMARVLKEDFLTPVRWVEARSRDTADNAAMSARLLNAAGVSHVLLVTHAYHMVRSRAAFEAQGLTVTPAPMGFMGNLGTDIQSYWLPSAQTRERARHGWRELIGQYWYEWRRDQIAPMTASGARSVAEPKQ